MIAQYDKVIVISDQKTGEKKAVVIFDEHLHLPVFFGIEKMGMDDILELIQKAGVNNPLPAGPTSPRFMRAEGGRGS